MRKPEPGSPERSPDDPAARPSSRLGAQDENANTQRALLVSLPLLLGYFSLNVPSGLTLYYLSNTLLSAAQQVYLKKLGGARVVIKELGPVTKPGSGRRLGEAGGGMEGRQGAGRPAGGREAGRGLGGC